MSEILFSVRCIRDCKDILLLEDLQNKFRKLNST